MITVRRSSLLTVIVIIVLLAATPFAVWEFIQTGELYVLSHRFLPDIVARFHGPGRLRFILQPTVATVLGMRDGAKDARAGSPPYLWGLAFHAGDRAGLIRSGLVSVRNLVAVAILLDVVAQLLIFRMVHPGAALLVGPVLIALPYSTSRALTNRFAQWRNSSRVRSRGKLSHEPSLWPGWRFRPSFTTRDTGAARGAILYRRGKQT